MLGKNRIRRIEGLTNCRKLSVLDLHGNRIGSIIGLDDLQDLKVNLTVIFPKIVSPLVYLELLKKVNK